MGSCSVSLWPSGSQISKDQGPKLGDPSQPGTPAIFNFSQFPLDSLNHQRNTFKRQYFANKGPSSQGYGFSSGHVWMWELDCEESWAPKNWCIWTVVLEKTLESPLDCKEIKSVHPKGNQPWIFIGRTDAEAETPILRPPDVKSWLIWKDPDAGKGWGRAGGEGDDREWDGWMASLTQWTWVWVDSGNWWWTGRPGVLRFMGSQRVRYDWATELNWTYAVILALFVYLS